MDKKELFIDGNGYSCYEGEMVYYVTLAEGGGYKTGWDFAEDIFKNMNVWHVLISLGIVKGLFKKAEKAREYCDDANCGSEQEINKIFFSNILK